MVTHDAGELLAIAGELQSVEAAKLGKEEGVSFPPHNQEGKFPPQIVTVI
jgi:hypothetical protein